MSIGEAKKKNHRNTWLKYISGDYLNPDDKKSECDCYKGGHVGHSIGGALNLKKHRHRWNLTSYHSFSPLWQIHFCLLCHCILCLVWSGQNGFALKLEKFNIFTFPLWLLASMQLRCWNWRQLKVKMLLMYLTHIYITTTRMRMSNCKFRCISMSSIYPGQ